MSRKPQEEKQREFAELKRFFVHWVSHVSPNRLLPLSHPGNPVNVLERFEQHLPFSQVLSGLKQAVNDCLESTEDWDRETIQKVDDSLAKAGAPSLSEMLVARSTAFRQMVRRRQIRNDTEYYLVAAALADTNSGRPPDEIELLSAMQLAYETRV